MNRHSISGFSLVEGLLLLAIGAFITATSVAALHASPRGQAGPPVSVQITDQAVKDARQSMPVDLVASARAAASPPAASDAPAPAPKGVVTPATSAWNRWGGTLVTRQDGADATVIAGQVPDNACIVTLSRVADRFDQITLNGRTLKSDRFAFSLATGADACRAGGLDNSLELTARGTTADDALARLTPSPRQPSAASTGSGVVPFPATPPLVTEGNPTDFHSSGGF
jgi:hypothetical protein